MKKTGDIEVVALTSRYQDWARQLICERWGSAAIVTRGIVHRADRAPGFVALAGGSPQGLLTHQTTDGDCEILTLNSLLEGRGIGRALIAAVREFASAQKFRRVWLITTNDNTAALRFYQMQGFQLTAIYRDVVKESRKLKPEIPEKGLDGIAIRDEIELELQLR